MKQLFLDAAHELRTPLTRIRGELELVLRGELGDPPRSQLESIHEDLERLSRLCGRLLLLARLEPQAGDAGLLSDDVQLDALIGELLERMSPLACDRGVSLGRGSTFAARVRGSRPLLVEAFLGLIDHAIRTATGALPVTVSMDADGGMVRVAVASPQSPGAAQGDAGSDLSLAIARGIARVHGGRFELDEIAGGGSLVRLALPVASAPLVSPGS